MRLRRLATWLAVLLLGVFTLLLASLLSSRPWQTSGLKVAGFRQIAVGMSRTEVERLLGGPPGDYGHNQGGPVTELGANWFKPPADTSTEVWANDDAKIHIAFDAEGKVVELYRQPAFVRTPAKLSWRYWWNCYFK